MSEATDKIEQAETRAKFDAVDQELVDIAVAIYQPQIEGCIPDLIGDSTDDIDNNDALFDYAGQVIHDDDPSLSYWESHKIASKIANYYFPVEG